jgi:hypothetical protein
MPDAPPVTIATRAPLRSPASATTRAVLGGQVSRRQDYHLPSLLVPGTGTIPKIY